MSAPSDASLWTLSSALAEITRLRTELVAAEARGIAVGLERAAQWHDDMRHQLQASLAQEQRTTRAIALSRSIKVHQLSAAAIRALPHDPIKADEGRG